MNKFKTDLQVFVAEEICIGESLYLFIEGLSEQCVQEVIKLAYILKGIHERLLVAGYTIHNGRIFKKEIDL